MSDTKPPFLFSIKCVSQFWVGQSDKKKKLVDWAMLKGEKGEWLIQFFNFNPFVGFLSYRLFENVIFGLPYFCPHF